MTVEEAKDKLDFLIDSYQMLIKENIGSEDVVGNDVQGTWKAETPCIDAYRDLINACKTAKEALDKQIPVEHHHTRVDKINDKIRLSICPNCLFINYTNENSFPKFCNWCGQKIKWSNDNDI